MSGPRAPHPLRHEPQRTPLKFEEPPNLMRSRLRATPKNMKGVINAGPPESTYFRDVIERGWCTLRGTSRDGSTGGAPNGPSQPTTAGTRKNGCPSALD